MVCTTYTLLGPSHRPTDYMSQLDLVGYLLERNDCPPELRSVKQRLTPPNPASSIPSLPPALRSSSFGVYLTKKGK